jgi:hypothetical protein
VTAPDRLRRMRSRKKVEAASCRFYPGIAKPTEAAGSRFYAGNAKILLI